MGLRRTPALPARGLAGLLSEALAKLELAFEVYRALGRPHADLIAANQLTSVLQINSSKHTPEPRTDRFKPSQQSPLWTRVATPNRNPQTNFETSE
jgi:hypothetical protein